MHVCMYACMYAVCMQGVCSIGSDLSGAAVATPLHKAMFMVHVSDVAKPVNLLT